MRLTQIFQCLFVNNTLKHWLFNEIHKKITSNFDSLRSIYVLLSCVANKGIGIGYSITHNPIINEESVSRYYCQSVLLFCSTELGHKRNTWFRKCMIESSFPHELQWSVCFDIDWITIELLLLRFVSIGGYHFSTTIYFSPNYCLRKKKKEETFTPSGQVNP